MEIYMAPSVQLDDVQISRMWDLVVSQARAKCACVLLDDAGAHKKSWTHISMRREKPLFEYLAEQQESSCWEMILISVDEKKKIL